MPVWVTEAGINDPKTPTDEKARRIRTWAERQPGQVQAVILFTIGRGTQWPQEEIDLRMAAEIGRCRYFPETGQPLCPPFWEYGERNGGITLFPYPPHGPGNPAAATPPGYERAVFAHHPGTPEGRVIHRRLCPEAADQSGDADRGIPGAQWGRYYRDYEYSFLPYCVITCFVLQIP